ncbi:MraY family glycosyltransferase [Candidatus Omnitrophota bacterium]
MLFSLSVTVFFLSLLVSSIATEFIIKIKGKEREGIPHLGGIAIWLSFLLATLIIFNTRTGLVLSKEFLGILVCSTLIFIVGLIDDKRELSVAVKLLTQLFAASLVMNFGVRTEIVGIGEFGNIVVTLLWILGITNAFNHLDIIDGLSSGIAFISAFTFYLISLMTFNIPVALFLLGLAGSILGFFRFNFPKAKIYMGNSGSHFLGFILGTFAIMISYATLEKRLALIIPLLILGLPVFDTLFVAVVRSLKHKPIWQKSEDHLPLRFIALGLSKKRMVIYMCFLTLIFCVSSILILYLSNKIGLVLLALLVVLCICIAISAKREKSDG